MDMVISPVSLSLDTLVLDSAGLKNLCSLWWKEQANSQVLHPVHASGSSSIRGKIHPSTRFKGATY